MPSPEWFWILFHSASCGVALVGLLCSLGYFNRDLWILFKQPGFPSLFHRLGIVRATLFGSLFMVSLAHILSLLFHGTSRVGADVAEILRGIAFGMMIVAVVELIISQRRMYPYLLLAAEEAVKKEDS